MYEGHPLRSASVVPVMEMPSKRPGGVMSIAVRTPVTLVTDEGDLGERPSAMHVASLDSVPPITKPEAKRTGVQTTNQLRFIHRVLIKMVWKHKSAWPFLTPVDTVKLNLPDYFDVVTNPMDLGTIRKRLAKHTYQCAADALADIKQVFDNCCLYNPPDLEVSQMGRAVEKFLFDKLKKMPATERPCSCRRPRRTRKTTTKAVSLTERQGICSDDRVIMSTRIRGTKFVLVHHFDHWVPCV